MNDIVHQLRCTGCARVVAQREARSNFRCAECGELFEVEYPAWSPASVQPAAANGHHGNGASTSPSPSAKPRAWMPNASALRWLWKERRHSALPIDQSGVWRFRELLPILETPNDAVTLREGNTPLYGMPRCAEASGMEHLLAKHQGMNPTGSFKDT